MEIIEIDRRKQVVVNKASITAFKNAIKEEYPVDPIVRDRIISMIEYYIG